MTEHRGPEPTPSDRPESDPTEVARRYQPENLNRLDQVGPYNILDLLGEGGMGVVYLAEQTKPIHRRVALKLIKPGMDTRQVIARFETEREALALMNHPNVARVFDAGTTEQGRPYFVMEYVGGIAITEYCDKHRLSTADRLGLFMAVCHAVQHAHQKGIIHRDIKPTNVLVTLEENKPVPKVIDFGMAKATQHHLTEWTLFTQHGQFVGTPGYISPEQAEMTPLDVDTRTDIYSLGVLLYELLVGTLPFDNESLCRAGLAEMQRIIREVDPPKPSTRLTVKGDKSTNIAQKRRAEPRTLARELRGDLDWIIMKCLEKDRTRRYDTANGLSMDIERHLRHEPVLAGPPSASYRLRKFIRRNKGPVVATSLLAAALVAGVIATSLTAAWALRERSEALAARDDLEQRSNELDQVARFQGAMLSGINAELMAQRLLEDMRIEVRAAMEQGKREASEIEARLSGFNEAVRGANITNVAVRSIYRNVLQRAMETIERQFPLQPLVQASLLQTVGDTLRNLGLYESATPPQKRCLEIREHLLGHDDSDTLMSTHSMGWLLFRQSQFAEAEPYLRKSLDGRRRVLGDDHRDTLTSINDYGWLLKEQGRFSEAEPYLREALDGRRRVLGNDHPHTLESMNNVGALLRDQDRLSEAEQYFREALEGRRRVLGDDDPETLVSINSMGLVVKAQRKLSQAEVYYREALEGSRRVLGDDHADTMSAINNMGMLLLAQKKLSEAEPYLREALDRRRRILGNDHKSTLISISNMGLLLKVQDRLPEAEPYYREALEGFRRVLGDNHQDTLKAINSMGSLLKAQGKLSEAESHYRKALDGFRRVLGDDHQNTLTSMTSLALLLKEQGRLAEAEPLLLEHFQRLSSRSDAKPGSLAESATALADLYDRQHAAEPDKGYDAKAATYRAIAEQHKAGPH